MSCQHLSNQTCQVLNETCFKLGKQSDCDFLLYYNLTINRSHDPPLAQAIKGIFLDPLIQSWKAYARNPAPGKKNMTARPFEDVIRFTLDQKLSSLGVTVSKTGEKYPVWEDISIIADCLIEKEGYPTCILSMKTWVGGEQIRETFAYAYFAKRWHRQKNIKVYMVIFQPIPTRRHLRDLIVLCSPHIDGVYSLCGQPYIDTLVEELQKIYV